MTRINLKKLVIGLVPGMFGILNPLLVHACPGCGAALDSTLGRGFNMSIVFLMAMPFLVFGTIVVGVIFVYRSHQNKAQSAAQNQIEDNQREESQN
ncbi:hypothetical protein GWO43_01350 [candidate division KSB1 bacterium]|nr:hypothetical protein [candidate division KSB1 bacterium]NIR69313.1 hypothetical protein [candidate division KSB1 bacterium]NIS22719.1 hypothetical protein [candidate division KSB1 bacterium]NIT69565.1 hypothetical protein [candidate division KSB1 bacterium]NIU23219.1 hypothetical protein [candidate division KSB1 bacterium]